MPALTVVLRRLGVWALCLVSLQGSGQTLAALPEPAALPSAASVALGGGTVLLEIGGDTVRWPEFYFWLNFVRRHQPALAGDALKAQAADLARKDRAIEAQAQARGIALDAADLRALAAQRDKDVRIFGGSEYRRIVARMYGNEAVFDYLSRIDVLGKRLFEALYGRHGERCSDAQVAEFITQQRLAQVRYVRLAAADASGERSAEQRAQQRLRLAVLKHRLESSPEPERDLQRAISETGEDSLMAESPEGRVISAGQLGPVFEAALAALAPGQLSAPVATPAGDYLIQRLPLGPDTPVDNTGQTLRHWAADRHLFQPQVAAWAAALPLQPTEAYRQLDPSPYLQPPARALAAAGGRLAPP